MHTLRLSPCVSLPEPPPPYRWSTHVASLDKWERVTLSVAIEEIAQRDGKPIAGVWEVLVSAHDIPPSWDNWGRTVESRLVQGWGHIIGGRREARHLVARARILCGLGADQGKLHVMPCLTRQAAYVRGRRESIRLKEWVGLD